MSKKISSKIELNVELDANRIPEKLFGLQKMVASLMKKQKL